MIRARLTSGPYLRRTRERVGVGPPRSVSASRCDTEDRDFCSGTRMTRARRVAGIVFHDDDLLDVATDDRARLSNLARDNNPHKRGNARWRWRGVTRVRRPGSTAVWRRKSEEVVLESGEALHR